MQHQKRWSFWYWCLEKPSCMLHDCFDFDNDFVAFILIYRMITWYKTYTVCSKHYTVIFIRFVFSYCIPTYSYTITTVYKCFPFMSIFCLLCFVCCMVLFVVLCCLVCCTLLFFGCCVLLFVLFVVFCLLFHVLLRSFHSCIDDTRYIWSATKFRPTDDPYGHNSEGSLSC